MRSNPDETSELLSGIAMWMLERMVSLVIFRIMDCPFKTETRSNFYSLSHENCGGELFNILTADIDTR